MNKEEKNEKKYTLKKSASNINILRTSIISKKNTNLLNQKDLQKRIRNLLKKNKRSATKMNPYEKENLLKKNTKKLDFIEQMGSRKHLIKDKLIKSELFLNSIKKGGSLTCKSKSIQNNIIHLPNKVIVKESNLKFLNRTNISVEIAKFYDILSSIPKTENVFLSPILKNKVRLILSFFMDRFTDLTSSLIKKSISKLPGSMNSNPSLSRENLLLNRQLNLQKHNINSFQEIYYKKIYPSLSFYQIKNEEVSTSDINNFSGLFSSELYENEKILKSNFKRSFSKENNLKMKSHLNNCKTKTDNFYNKQDELFESRIIDPKLFKEKLKRIYNQLKKSKVLINESKQFKKLFIKTIKYYEEVFDETEFNSLVYSIIQKNPLNLLEMCQEKYFFLKDFFKKLTKLFAQISKGVLFEINLIPDLRISQLQLKDNCANIVYSQVIQFIKKNSKKKVKRQIIKFNKSS